MFSIFTQQAVNESAVALKASRTGFDVVMLTTAHAAIDDRIFYREATTLVEAGLSVCVVGQHVLSEHRDGVWIEALPAAGNRLGRLMMGWSVMRRVRRLKGRLFVFHDPELFVVGLVLSFLGYKVVYDAHENLPCQVLQKNWIPRPIRWLLVPEVWLAELVFSRFISGVIVATDRLLTRFPRSRTVLVRNFPTTGALQVLGGGPPVELRRNIVIYTGGLSRIRGIGELVKAFDDPELSDAELWLVGGFESDQFEEEILHSASRNVRWLGRLEHPDVLKLYQSAKIGIVLLYPTPNHRHSLPVKLFEYLGAGLAVVASDFPELTKFVRGCGFQVNPQSVTQIRDAIKNLLSDDKGIAEMSSVARNRVLSALTWEKEGARLVAFCSKLVQGG